MSNPKELGTSERRLLGMRDAGQYAGLSPWTIRKRIYSGTWAGVKLGTKLLIEKAELDRAIEQGRTKK